MPEGDTVYRAAAKLDRALTGHRLVFTDFRVPALATVDLREGTVIRTLSRGKHLLTRVDHVRAWTIHTHLKMEGSWHVYPDGERWRRPASRGVGGGRDRVSVGRGRIGVVAETASKKTETPSGASRPRLMLMDGHSLAYRAFFALPAENFTTATGQPTNAIYGFASMLANTANHGRDWCSARGARRMRAERPGNNSSSVTPCG